MIEFHHRKCTFGQNRQKTVDKKYWFLAKIFWGDTKHKKIEKSMKNLDQKLLSKSVFSCLTSWFVQFRFNFLWFQSICDFFFFYKYTFTFCAFKITVFSVCSIMLHQTQTKNKNLSKSVCETFFFWKIILVNFGHFSNIKGPKMNKKFVQKKKWLFCPKVFLKNIFLKSLRAMTL